MIRDTTACLFRNDIMKQNKREKEEETVDDNGRRPGC
jgi:hypothetical protein